MREIKFRGKALSDDHKWLYGNLNVNDDGKTAIMRIGDFWSLQRVAPETVGQYTGKKDVNKKEIFEGDVVYFLDDRAHERIGVIKWHEKMYCWIIDCGEAGRDMLAYYACEIRGNVHDNPELIS